MKRLLVVLFAVMIVLAALTAQAAVFKAMTVSSTAVGITGAEGLNYTECLCVVETDSIRVRWDGTAPTSAVGMLLTPGTFITVVRWEIAPFRAIRTNTDATLDCMCK